MFEMIHGIGRVCYRDGQEDDSEPTFVSRSGDAVGCICVCGPVWTSARINSVSILRDDVGDASPVFL